MWMPMADYEASRGLGAPDGGHVLAAAASPTSL